MTRLPERARPSPGRLRASGGLIRCWPKWGAFGLSGQDKRVCWLSWPAISLYSNLVGFNEVVLSSSALAGELANFGRRSSGLVWASAQAGRSIEPTIDRLCNPSRVQLALLSLPLSLALPVANILFVCLLGPNWCKASCIAARPSVGLTRSHRGRRAGKLSAETNGLSRWKWRPNRQATQTWAPLARAPTLRVPN